MMARTTYTTMQNLVKIAPRTSAWKDEMWRFSLFYRQDLPQAALPVLFYSGPGFGVFRSAGATRYTDQGKIWQGRADYGPHLPAKFHLDRLRGRVTLRPQNWKKWNFTNIIAPKGRVPCTIFTKFTGYMRVLSIYHVAEFKKKHNFAKYRCLISINDKIINNLLRWGVFSQIFDDP